MRRNKGSGLEIVILMLIIPLIVYWRELLIIGIIFVTAKIIYKIIKIISIIDEKKAHLSKKETYKEKTVTYESKQNKIHFLGDVVKLEEVYEPTYAYLEDKYVSKGIEAEKKIVRILQRIFEKENIIHDSYFRDDELVTTQVDVIAIDRSGIYVIESKAYSSIIKGNTKQRNWVQLFSGKNHQLFLNPIIQNNRHVKAIKKNLSGFGLPKEVFKSYIVFADDCKLCVDYDENCDVKVIQQKELFYTMLEDRKTTENIMSEKQVKEISKRINGHANVDESLKMAHIVRRKNNVKYTTKGR